MDYIYFISDLHLSPQHPEVANAFIHFLKEQTHKAKSLYILGDFFEVWLGDDLASDFDNEIISALNVATKSGLPIYFIHGNRDFLIGKDFCKKSGIQILKDPSLITLFGKKWMISHGDYLCTKDRGHMLLRKITLNPINQFLFLHSPLFFRKKIAAQIRGKSRQSQKTKRKEYMDVNPITVEKEMQRLQVENLIHGHTHEGAIHPITIDNKPATRIVLGDWHETAKVLKYEENGQFSLDTLRCPPLT